MGVARVHRDSKGVAGVQAPKFPSLCNPKIDVAGSCAAGVIRTISNLGCYIILREVKVMIP
jgi:hypothetical protein